MNFTFQGSNPGGTGMSTLPKQLIMRAIRGFARGGGQGGIVRSVFKGFAHPVAALPKQVLLAMQLSAILLFAVCFQVGATSTYGQATVSFTGKDVPLKTVFASVKKQTGYGVFFENGEAMLQSSAPVTLDLKNVALETFLRICLKDQPLEYTMEGKTIFIKKKEAPIVTLAPAPTLGDPILQIKGRVTNDKGEPLVNANITVKRTGHGTITDANGNFTLRNVNSDDVVMVSFIGYNTQSMPLKDRISLTVVMSPTTNDLDKVVVQAYGTTSQRLATGNIGTVRAEDIAKQPVMNVLEAIQGQVPGVVVSPLTGQASGTIKVEIRGRNTINNVPSDPLYIIDGVPLTVLDLGTSSYNGGSQGVIQSAIGSPAEGQSPLFSMNPADIESVEILKDADATAIYGSRGSNGVILITTKKGKPGKSHLEINAYDGYDKIPHHYNFLNTKEYVAMRREALNNDSLPVDINNAPDLTVWDTSRFTNWQKYLWGGTGRTTEMNLSLSGGDTRTNFRIGGGYHYQRDLTTVSGSNERISFSFNITHKSLNQRFAMSLTTSYNYIRSNLISVPGNPTIPPNAPAVYDSLGSLNYLGWAPLANLYTFSTLLQPYESKTNFLTSNLLITYEIAKGLTLKTNLGYNNSQNNQSFTIPIASQNPLSAPQGTLNTGYTFFNNLIIEPQIEYNSFFHSGKFSMLIGSSTQDNTTSSTTLFGYGYLNDGLLSSINNAPGRDANYYKGEYRYAAVFSRINYNWKDKFIVNLNGRRDGSSKFGPGRQYGNFGSIGGAWIFSEEQLIKNNLHFLSYGKIRSSYGVTGGDQVGDYKYLTQWGFGNLTYNNNLPLTPLGHTDSVYHWQVNKKLEISLELSFLHDRLTLQTAYYRDRCDNQLILFRTPIFTGFGSVTTNSPANVQNTGYEVILNGKIIEKKDISWSARFNIGINRNKLLAYPNLAQSPYAFFLTVGKSLNISRLLHYTGVDPQTGLYTYQHKNKDSIINPYPGPDNDLYDYDLSTKFDGGFSSAFRYKSFDLSFFFYFRKQMRPNAYALLSTPGQVGNIPEEVYQHRWTGLGSKAEFAKLTANPSDNSYYYLQLSDASISDASFIRLKNIRVSYTLNGSILKKLNISNLVFYIKGENIFVLTRYKGTDPEVNDFGALPIPRILTMGITCNL